MAYGLWHMAKGNLAQIPVVNAVSPATLLSYWGQEEEILHSTISGCDVTACPSWPKDSFLLASLWAAIVRVNFPARCGKSLFGK